MADDTIVNCPLPTPSRANYGFALYLGSKVSFLLYLCWALVPYDSKVLSWIHQLALPCRYWAVALPIWVLVVGSIIVFIIYPAMNLAMTPSPTSSRVMRDSYSRKRHGNNDIPPIYDVPPETVSRILYLGDHSLL